MFSRSHQPIANLPADALLPKALRKQAAVWRALDSKLDDLDIAGDQLQNVDLPAAVAQDKADTIAAVNADEPLPPEHQNEREVQAQIRETGVRFRQVESNLREAGAELATQLRAHREELAQAIAPGAEAALDGFRRAVAHAEAALADATRALRTQAQLLAMLRDLDQRADELGALAPRIDVPEISGDRDAEDIINRLLMLTEQLDDSTKFQVRGRNGNVLELEASQIYGLLASDDSGAELVDPADEERIKRAVGADRLPSEWRHRQTTTRTRRVA